MRDLVRHCAQRSSALPPRLDVSVPLSERHESRAQAPGSDALAATALPVPRGGTTLHVALRPE